MVGLVDPAIPKHSECANTWVGPDSRGSGHTSGEWSPLRIICTTTGRHFTLARW